VIRNERHARAVIGHHEICAHPEDDSACRLCGRIAKTEISDADGWWTCEECTEEREAWMRCEGCAVLVPRTEMRHIDGDPTTDALCPLCIQTEHERRENAENDGRYDGADWVES